MMRSAPARHAVLAVLAAAACSNIADTSAAECAPAQSEAPRRPGQEDEQAPPTPCDPTRLPLPRAELLAPPEPMPDRWRIVESIGYPDNRLDPYAGNNPLKGDRPVFGHDGYAAWTVTSSSLAEPRRVPAAGAGSVDQLFVNENVSFDLVLYRGDTVFRPPDYQLRFTPVISYSETRDDGTSLRSTTFAAQSLFFEKHLRDVSPQYDFDSVRVGIQPVTSDFRGFLLRDAPAGVRLFGTRANNLYQYNLAWFRPLAKNAARLNDLGASPPHEDIVLANLYRQDLLQPGFNAALALVYDRNRSQREHDVLYVGASGDGHFGRVNLTSSLYFASGHEAVGTFSAASTAVRASMAAAELSVDFDRMRGRLSALRASGDADPQDDRAAGFGGLLASPVFAGADSSFFLHQRLPLSDTVDLKQRDRLFDDLSSNTPGAPASFSGPGLRLLGLGIDFDVSSRLRISADANQLWFDETAPLALASGQPVIAREIGQDYSVNAFFRPLDSQNIIVRISAAALTPGRGYRDLYGEGTQYSAFCNLVLTY